MKQVVIHMGAHRSASTAIQNLLRPYRDALAAAGVALVLRADMEMPGALDARRLHWHRPYSPAAHIRLVRFSGALARMPSDRVLISEENLMGTMPGVLDRRFYPKFEAFVNVLAKLRNRYDIHPRLVVRRQDRFLESVYAFRVARGQTDDFETFVKSFDGEQLSWFRLARTLEKAGFADVGRILVLESLPTDGQGAVLADFLCVGDVLGATALRPHGNTSFSNAALRLLLAMNRAGIATDRAWRRQQLFPLLWRDGETVSIDALDEAGLEIADAERAVLIGIMAGDLPLGFAADQRASFLASCHEDNTGFLAHASVMACEGVWAV